MFHVKPESHQPVAHRPLTTDDFLPDGPLARICSSIQLFETIESTNAHLLSGAAAFEDGTVAAAEYQTAGRGRLGRQWLAPRGSSLLISVLLHERRDSALPGNATLLAAVAACEAIERVSDVCPVIRWPNDLAYGGRKLGGVLAESKAGAGQMSRAGGDVGMQSLVIGLGINCLQQRGHFPPEIADKATSLEIESAKPVDRARLAGLLLAHLDSWVMRIGEGGEESVGALQAAWHRRCGDIGGRVTLHHDGRTFEGTVVEISEDGDLVIQLEHGGRRHFAAANTTRVW